MSDEPHSCFQHVVDCLRDQRERVGELRRQLEHARARIEQFRRQIAKLENKIGDEVARKIRGEDPLDEDIPF